MTLTLSKPPVMETAMLIRRPAHDVYEAFVDPAVTSRFWFSKGDRRLEPGGTARWDWEWFGFGADVKVRALEPERRIEIEWGSEDDGFTSAEWRFTPRGDDATMVEIKAWGFTGDGDAQVASAIDSMGGFNLVLAGAKAWLEHGVALNIVPDRFPDLVK